MNAYNTYNKFNNATTAYKQEGILTASPAELVIIMYDALIKQYKIAKMCIENKSIEKANNALQFCGDILVELSKGLDFNYDIARDLMELYNFVTQLTITANLKKDTKAIDDILDIITELRDAWMVVKSSAGSKIATVLED